MTTNPTATSLEPFFTPSSVAIIGASDDAARIGGRPLRYLKEYGFSGRIYPINPKRDTVQGLKAWPSVADLPEVPDIALIAVPAAHVAEAVEACALKGIKGAIIFSAGFAETDEAGRAMQEAILAKAQAHGLRVLGPNCLGSFCTATGFYGTFSAILDGGKIESGPLAIVSQSGAYGSHLAFLFSEKGLGLSHFLTTGNEGDIDVAEGLLWAVKQPEAKVIVAYVEGIKRADIFIEALREAKARRKPVIIMKVGRSEVGQEAVASHTAALAGADNIYDAVFRQYGAVRARTTAEQVDIAYACARGLYPTENRLGIFTLSGGFGIQMADAAEEIGLAVTAMPEAVQGELRALLPYASPRNPVDATAQALTDLDVFSRYLGTMLDKGGYDAVIGIFGSAPASPSFGENLIQALERIASAYPDKLLAITASISTALERRFARAGILVFEDGHAAVAALAGLGRAARGFARGKEPIAPPALPLSLPDHALDEHESKALLARHAIPFPPESVATTAEDAVHAARKMGGAVVLKIVSPDIAHKTEIGGVLLNLTGDDAVRQGFSTIMARVNAAKPDAQITGILVAPMLRDGVEVIAGVHHDPVFGPVIMFGLGGIHVEVMKDVTFRKAPFGRAEALCMIDEIRGRALLDGVRGAPPSDVDALADLLAALSGFAHAAREAKLGVDLNPVLVRPQGLGAVALDALVLSPAPDGKETSHGH
ncbi:MAG: acyl-CoA synthetase [Rhizobiales bacterium PAR1]|nr:MAG: acyl-CoA synthetase [Rhizobiales bacterium PAR1]